MAELQVQTKVTQIIPAKVSFNYAEIDTQLDVTLKKYNGLVFTEDTVKECKKTMTELRKGKKSLNDFRIKTKALLTEDITKFEDQCKKLNDKFDTVINPISLQADKFEVDRREQKRIDIQTIIDTLTDERFLEYKYYSQLVITEQMLNKGTKIKAINIDLTNQADLLLSQQNIEEANIELIKSKVELANSQYGVTLLNNLYLGLLEDGKDINSLIKMINENAEKTKIVAEEAEAERLAIEARKAERKIKLEADNVAQKKADRVNHERQIELEKRREADRAKWKAEEEAESERLDAIKKEESRVNEAKVIIPGPSKVVEQAKLKATETYTVTGTETQLDALEEYLNDNGYTWI
ncbi:DUF1351 domain-containing protein [Clostridium estertheticum]|uniref:DUF1351 domain-containing protein n=1 Tax=Clostridium estertheticum TaxID=238834 RepID=A0AA47I7Q7_9CLOT|nr:DUF1351 domain-containing protein [Clostridium estertheticum]MBU3155151.1 DUF1351 domain-containing protein [Clostridium estertheticum]WAG61205.1 DUF1351 domain-containing protein [Clostridium estertheticum]